MSVRTPNASGRRKYSSSFPYQRRDGTASLSSPATITDDQSLQNSPPHGGIDPPGASMIDLKPVPSPPVPVAPKRGGGTRNADDEKQRERKRALDRKAQRTSREKTRAHIAHLEKMVEILSDKNGSATTADLMGEIGRLHAEIDRLRKIIDSIKSLLGIDIVQSAAPRQSGSPDAEASDGPVYNESNLCEIKSPAEDRSTALGAAIDRYSNRAATENNLDLEVADELAETPLEVVSNSTSIEKVEFVDSADKGHVVLARPMHYIRNFNLPPQQIWSQPPNPLKTGLPTPVPDFQPCKVWQKANVIFSQIYNFKADRVSAANKVDSGTLVRVVREGWDALPSDVCSNPLLRILKDVDQQLFRHLDPVTKIANLYKTQLLLKYYFNGEKDSLESVPPWQRPVHSQQIQRHPIPIDFFPWPSLRDRLVRFHNYYFATSDFSDEYRQHLKFNWPHSFEDTYCYDAKTRTYRISPLFERCHRDMRYWSMDKVFFDKFPELKGEISEYPEAVNDAPPPTQGWNMPADNFAFPQFNLFPGFTVRGCSCRDINDPSDCTCTDPSRMMDFYTDFPPA